jgi:hypothetical protein
MDAKHPASTQCVKRDTRPVNSGSPIAHDPGVHRIFAWVIVLLAVPAASGYSVLTHEAIIDSAWDKNIQPLLVKRFPQAAADDLRQAHGYTYAGCIIQDMGYYPFGSKFFSDLVHYVRSGDFVVAMVRDAQDLNEYAFALGALAHYAADNHGHPIAVNPAVGIEYPKLAEKYGSSVTYAENPSAHIKVEFGFDVLQVARGRYAPQAYHDFIGFQVSKPVLERAFRDTYSLELKDVFSNLDLALGTYRHTVSSLIPEMTRVAWNLKKDELAKAEPGVTRRKFTYNLSRASYRKEWDGKYERPGTGARLLAFLFRIMPKVGPFKAAGFKTPTPQTAKLFEDSFDQTLDQYRSLLAGVGEDKLALENRDFDTGQPTRPVEYKLADNAYSKLAIKLAQKDPQDLDRKVLDNILGFYRDLNLPYASKNDPQQWSELMAALGKLEAGPGVPRNPAAAETSLSSK